jgi:hypothetical protein
MGCRVEMRAGGRGIGVQGGAEITNLLGGLLAEAGGASLGTVLLLLRGGGLFGKFGGSGSMAEGDGRQALRTIRSGEGERSLEKTLGAHEIGLEARTQRIAAPGGAGSAKAGAAQERIIEDGTEGSVGRQFSHHGAADDGEDGLDGKTGVGEDAVAGGPVTELRAASGEQTGHGMASQTEQGAQRESLGVRGEAALVEAGEAWAPELFERGEDAGRAFFLGRKGPARPVAGPADPCSRRTIRPFRRARTPWTGRERKGN